MTINNYGVYSNPLQNPFNSRIHGNYNPSKNGYFSRGGNPSRLSVPRTMPFSQVDRNYWDNVHTPCQNQIPMGSENNMMYFDSDRYMKLPDGSVIDLKLKKIVKNGIQADNETWSTSFMNQVKEECWTDDDKTVDSGTGMTIKDYERQKFLDKKEDELKKNMNNLQKQLLWELEHGKLFPLSKLEDCEENEW